MSYKNSAYAYERMCSSIKFINTKKSHPVSISALAPDITLQKHKYLDSNKVSEKNVT